MPNTRRTAALVVIAALAFTAGCGGDSSGPPAVATVDVSTPQGDIVVGQTAQLSATTRDASGNVLSNRTVAWSSSSTTIATVGSSGLVTGVAPGSATISALSEGKTGTRLVTIVRPPVATVTVSIELPTILVGQITQATAVLRDGGGNVLTGRDVVWGTNSPSVASISGAGVITGLAVGTATISASSEGQAGSAVVTVAPPNPAEAPTITTVTPSPLVEGQAATITGTKFGASAAANAVRVGGVSAVVTSASATSLQIVVPQLNCKPAQAINVEVTTNGLTSAPKAQPFRPGATFSLAQGQQRIIPSANDFCLQFDAAAGAESYLIGVQSIAENVASVTPVRVTSEVPAGGVTAAALAVANTRTFSSMFDNPLASSRSLRMAQYRATSAKYLEIDRAELVSRLPAVRRAQKARASGAAFASVPTVPATAKVGDVLNVRVPDRIRGNTCQNSIAVAATVKAVGARSIILEDNTNPTGGYSASDYQSLSTEFDNRIYAVDVAYFGEPTDQDNNQRVAIIITKEVNRLNNVGGFVSTIDLLPQSECPTSNEGEVFYGKAPDPTGVVNGTYSIEAAREDAPILIAHEFAHIIQLGRRVFYPPATAIQSTWELEGQATFAEEVTGFAVTGLAPGQNLGFAVAFNSPVSTPIDWFVGTWADLAVYYGFESRTSRVLTAPEQCSWLGRPEQGNTGPCALGGREPYGVPSSFFRWLSDHFGASFPGGEQGMHKRLVENAFTGFATITDVVGVPIDVLLAQWAASLYIDDRITNPDVKLTFKSWNLKNIESGLVQTAWLIPKDRPFGAFTDNVSVRGGSTAYFIVSGTGRGPVAVRVRDGTDVPLPGTMRLWVVRMQ